MDTHSHPAQSQTTENGFLSVFCFLLPQFLLVFPLLLSLGLDILGTFTFLCYTGTNEKLNVFQNVLKILLQNNQSAWM